jgi:hypothetical protein
MLIAMSRPPNLWDILYRTNIPNLSRRNTSDILDKIEEDQDSRHPNPSH